MTMRTTGANDIYIIAELANVAVVPDNQLFLGNRITGGNPSVPDSPLGPVPVTDSVSLTPATFVEILTAQMRAITTSSMLLSVPTGSITVNAGTDLNLGQSGTDNVNIQGQSMLADIGGPMTMRTTGANDIYIIAELANVAVVPDNQLFLGNSIISGTPSVPDSPLGPVPITDSISMKPATLVDIETAGMRAFTSGNMLLFSTAGNVDIVSRSNIALVPELTLFLGNNGNVPPIPPIVIPVTDGVQVETSGNFLVGAQGGCLAEDMTTCGSFPTM